ncbi:MAG TPA: ATP-binding protein [Candidatus Binatia bacterium]|nr:ATP-binding protein [Candidatus Binatia bacterium]
MVSHELRTPLGAILGWSKILLRQALDARLKHGLEVIDRNTRTQIQLVSDLLDISRITSGKLALEVDTVEVASVVRDSIETLQHAADNKHIELVARIGSDPIFTVGDAARLRQVVSNILSNAIKFTETGGRVEVHVGTSGSSAEIVVTDTGIGIRSDDLTFLFERFRQSGPTTTRRYGGLGLGLSIARHIVELHGGTVRAESDGEGKGARFTVEIPLRSAAHLAGEASVADRAMSHTDTGVSLDGLTVLVVEDASDMLALIKVILESHGATVIAATSAADALRALGRSPDIIVSDIRLPDMDGYELVRKIRSGDEPSARTPAVALTAFARIEDRTRAIRAGFQGHIAKPFEPMELVLTIASLAGIVRPIN